MKLLLDIQSDKLATLMTFLKNLTDVSVEKITETDADLLMEIKEIKQAIQHSEMINSGTLKARPINDLLDEL